MPSRPAAVTRDQAIALEVAAWDRVAPRRAVDFDENRDPSYRFVLQPAILHLLGPNPNFVLDAGCGVGRLTYEISKRSTRVVGIDPSRVSANLARDHLRSRKNVTIFDLSIEQYAELEHEKHDYCAALMVMQDVVDLGGFLRSARRVLGPRGQFVAAITNPQFWPKYWGYDSEPWFKQEREIFIRSEFRTSLSSSGISTLHVHRPKEMYLSALADAGFKDVETWEPMMPPTIQRRSGVNWEYPHFWVIRGKVQ